MGVALVGGVIIEWSALVPAAAAAAAAGDLQLPAASHSLLRCLRHSNLPTGISLNQDDPENDEEKEKEKEKEIRRVIRSAAALYSLDCFVFRDGSSPDILHLTRSWGGGASPRTLLYVASKPNPLLFQSLSLLRTWLILLVDADAAHAHAHAHACPNDSTILHISKLQELPLTICRLNSQATANNVLTVAYTMKPSRQEDFSKRGAFPISPTANGLMFLPLTFELPLAPQLCQANIILHKATDEIISIELGDSSESFNRVTYTKGMEELLRYLEHISNCLVVDPLDKILPVLDRLKIQQILLGLRDLKTGSRCTIRGPHFLKVNAFNEPGLVQLLSRAKLSLPIIVKPQVACGVADAHSMGIVFRVEDFNDLKVPLPAVIQEYVDHSSTLFKIYVLGGRVFYAVKKSTPNVDILWKISEKDGFKPLLFDSLKSLPTSTEQAASGNSLMTHTFDLDLVTDAASWLSRKLDLTIFGFDVVIQEGTCDHVIVDVNYLPSFKEVPDDVAIPAFWDAVKGKFEA